MSKVKVKNHVNYLKANGRLQSAKVLTVVDQNTVTLKIGHQAALVGNKTRHTNQAVNQTDKWRKTA